MDIRTIAVLFAAAGSGFLSLAVVLFYEATAIWRKADQTVSNIIVTQEAAHIHWALFAAFISGAVVVGLIVFAIHLYQFR